MTISFGNTQISLEDGNTAAAPQTQAPSAPAKKGHGKLLYLQDLEQQDILLLVVHLVYKVW